jgi:hypothetical protein
MTKPSNHNRAPDLHAEASAARMLVEAMEQHGFDGTDISISLESETEFVETVASTVRRIDELEQLAASASLLAARYKAREEDLKSRRETLRGILADALERSQAPLPLRLAEGTVTLGHPSPGVRIISEADIPDTYWRVYTNRKVDVRSVGLDLRDGRSVPGAALANARPTVVVRRS